MKILSTLVASLLAQSENEDQGKFFNDVVDTNFEAVDTSHGRIRTQHGRLL